MRTSIAARANLDLIEENYRRWRRNPESVDSGWAAFFEGFELGETPEHHRARKPARREAPAKSIADPARTRFQRKGSRSSRCIEILLRQPADDAARHDW